MTVWSSAGAESRSRSELGLTSVEQQRMLRNNNGITSTYMSEKDARSSEADGEDQKIADKNLKKVSSEHMRTAANLALAGAIIGAIGTITNIALSSTSAQGVDWFKAAPDLLNALNNIAQKWLDTLKADAEVDAVNKELNRLKSDRLQTAGHVKALDTNPYA